MMKRMHLQITDEPATIAVGLMEMTPKLPHSGNHKYEREAPGAIYIRRTDFQTPISVGLGGFFVPFEVRRIFPDEVFIPTIVHYTEMFRKSNVSNGYLDAAGLWEQRGLSSRPCVDTWGMSKSGWLIARYRANDVANKLLLNILFLLAIHDYFARVQKRPRIGVSIISKSLHVRAT